MGVFLAALDYRHAPVFVPAHGHLLDASPFVEDLTLALDLVVQGQCDGAEGVQVLDLNFGTVLGGTHGAQGDVGLAAHGPLFHVAAADAQVAQDLAQLGQVGVGFVG